MLNRIVETLNSTFLANEDWLNPFFTDNDVENGSLKEEELKSFLGEKLLEISKNLSDSILIGEYIKDAIDFPTNIGAVIENSDSVYENILFHENTQLHNHIENFVKVVKHISSEYSKFYNLIQTHILKPNIEIVFSSSSTNFSDEFFKKSFQKDILQEFNNVFNLIILNTYDHFFDESTNYFKSLLDFENGLKIDSDKNPTPYIGAINDKILFLKYKWVIRQITTSKVVKSNKHYSYILDNEIKSINKAPVFGSSNPKLNEWKEYLENHYGYIEHSNFYDDRINDLLTNKEETDFKFYDYHFLIKYFKDVKPNYENLKEIVEKIEKKESEFKNNKSLFFKNLNYSLNNLFSLLIEDVNADEEQIKTLKARINSSQNKTGNNNFFVDYKFLKFSIEKLNVTIKNREPLEIKDEINTRINEIRELILSCERKINWSENHHNLLYQLPYEESLVKYNTDSINEVYYASSFLLPLSVEQIRKEFFDLKLEFQNKYNHFEVLSTLDKEFSVIRGLKKNAEDSEKRSIETLTIYTAIISFIVGTISGFSFIDSFIKAIIFILIFSISLCTFVLLIFLSTRSISIIKNNKKTIIALYVSFLIILVLLFCYKNKFDDKMELEKIRVSKEIGNKKYIDSLNQIQNEKFNSIKSSMDSLKVIKTTPLPQGGQTQLKNQ